jgi:hypothetical protein
MLDFRVFLDTRINVLSIFWCISLSKQFTCDNYLYSKLKYTTLGNLDEM